MSSFLTFPNGRSLERGQSATGAAAPPRWSKGSGYSRLVQVLRLALPVLAVLLFLTVALWRDLIPNPQLIGLEDSALPASEVDELTMIKPRFDGLDEDGQPYTLTALRANQLNEDGDVIFLESPAADITLTSGRWVAISATGGTYFREEERLHLEGQVSLFQDDGYELETSAATINFASGLVDSDAAVAGHGPRGEMQAEGLTVAEQGDLVELKGQSRVLLLPQTAGNGSL
ncbi:MAG: LPS export ABC transporter periplasmic protein LptC [Pseudomonadota bacterium]